MGNKFLLESTIRIILIRIPIKSLVNYLVINNYVQIYIKQYLGRWPFFWNLKFHFHNLRKSKIK